MFRRFALSNNVNLCCLSHYDCVVFSVFCTPFPFVIISFRLPCSPALSLLLPHSLSLALTMSHRTETFLLISIHRQRIVRKGDTIEIHRRGINNEKNNRHTNDFHSQNRFVAVQCKRCIHKLIFPAWTRLQQFKDRFVCVWIFGKAFPYIRQIWLKAFNWAETKL